MMLLWKLATSVTNRPEVMFEAGEVVVVGNATEARMVVTESPRDLMKMSLAYPINTRV